MLLLGALSIAAFFAACITGWIVAAYAVYRFAIILTHSQNLPQGLKVRLKTLLTVFATRLISEER